MKTSILRHFISAALLSAAASSHAGLATDALGLNSPPVNQGLVTDPLGLSNGQLHYLAAPGAVNTVTLVVQNGRVVLTDSSAPLPPCAPIQGMLRPDANTVSFPAAAVQSVRVALGDLNDSLNAAGFTRPLSVTGGGGNDTIVGGDGSDFLHGNDGDDTLWGGGGTDEICGGNGNDSLTGDAGDDELTGDAGDDFITVALTPSLCGGADDDQIVIPVVHGGAGHDTLSLKGRSITAAQEAALTQQLSYTGLEVMEIAGH